MRYYSEETVREMMDQVRVHVKFNVPYDGTVERKVVYPDFSEFPSIDEFPDTDMRWHTDLPTECGEYLIAYGKHDGGISYGWATWDNKAWDINFSDFQQGDKILAWHNKFEVYVR